MSNSRKLILILIDDKSGGRAIFLMFLNNFNKYCDNLPSTKEIENAITKNLIIKKTDNENIIGFLWFDKKQILTELRYLYVNENYRGLKISNKLMNQYLYLTKNFLQVLLFYYSKPKNLLVAILKYLFFFHFPFYQIGIEVKFHDLNYLLKRKSFHIL